MHSGLAMIEITLSNSMVIENFVCNYFSNFIFYLFNWII